MAQSLESERKGERFTLIEPPLQPEEPVKPNRPAIAFVGIALAVGGAIVWSRSRRVRIRPCAVSLGRKGFRCAAARGHSLHPEPRRSPPPPAGGRGRGSGGRGRWRCGPRGGAFPLHAPGRVVVRGATQDRSLRLERACSLLGVSRAQLFPPKVAMNIVERSVEMSQAEQSKAGGSRGTATGRRPSRRWLPRSTSCRSEPRPLPVEWR